MRDCRKHMAGAWRAARAIALIGTIGALALFGRMGSPSAHEKNGGESIVGVSVIPYAGEATQAAEHAFFVSLTDETIRSAVSQAIERALGPAGLGAIVERGDKVVVKTNIVEADLREGVVTDPRVCRAVCGLALEAAGPTGSVTVVDACFGKGVAAFGQAGYDDDGDGRLDGLSEVRFADLDSYRTTTSLLVTTLSPKLFWTDLWLPDILRTREQAQAGPADRAGTYCDVLITVPNFKNHSNAGMTCALKNRIGCASLGIYADRQKVHYTGTGANCLNESIIDLNRARPDDFAILDGLTGNIRGPNNRSLPAAQRHSVIIHPFFFLASDDSVALDAIATHIAGYRVSTIRYLATAQTHGLGTCATASIRAVGPTVDSIRDDLKRRYQSRSQYPFPDNYGSVNVARRRTDVDPPSAATILEPASGARLPPGPVTVRFTAIDSPGTGIAKVEMLVDGAWAATVSFSAAPQADGEWTWDATGAALGEHRLQVVAYDDEFASRASEEVVVTVGDIPFSRGDTNGDAEITIADPIFALNYLFASGARPPCLRAADANDDGTVDLSDPVSILRAIFTPGRSLPAPYPDCGTDDTPDALDCAISPCGGVDDVRT